MTLELSYPHIEKPPDQPARLQRLPRIRVADLVTDHLAHGWSAEEIFRQHPHLLPAEVYAALGYYYDHRAEIDQEIDAEWNQARQLSPHTPHSPFWHRYLAARS